MLTTISMDIDCNQDFQLSQFQRQMEQTVTECKGEVESFLQNRIQQLNSQPFIELGEQTQKIDSGRLVK